MSAGCEQGDLEFALWLQKDSENKRKKDLV
jgi:hypothetical protein